MPHRFHGRIRERNEVLGLLDGAERGGGGALIVEGHEGTGKSALLDEAITDAERRGFGVATAAALGGSEVVPLAPFLRALGEAGEQNAPLGRAVIGGLSFATVATLIFVPVVFSIAHRKYGRGGAPSSAIGEPHVA